MTFTIHRGANEIGGICIEVCTEKTRIVLDIGMPLVNTDGSRFDAGKITGLSIDELLRGKILPGIPALYGNTKDKKTALLISHAHQDHYGLIGFIDKQLPVYIGKASHKLIELSAFFAGKETVIENPFYFNAYESFGFGDMEITPYLMDHACCDAYAFLIRSGGKTLFYSGDFRGHGRKWKWFHKFLHAAPKNVDYMLMEGTSLSRHKHKFQSENRLENQFVKTFGETKGINLAFVSGQNIDRLVTIYRACRKCGKIFAIDFYIATVLYELAQLGYGVPYPSPGFPGIRVFYPSMLIKRMKHLKRDTFIDFFNEYHINLGEINKKAKHIVMTIRTSMAEEIRQIQHISNGTLIYSMWDGYRENRDTEKFINNIVNRGAAITNIHTSGHADLFTLRKMVNAVQPKELIPVHTLESNQYQKYFPNVKSGSPKTTNPYCRYPVQSV